MRDEDAETGAFEGGFYAVEGGVELDGSYYCDGFAGGEVAFEGGDEVGGVDANVDEDVEGFYRGDVHRDETAMRVMYQQVAP